jgi:hypothetical protein
MLLATISLCAALAIAAEIVWRNRHDADLRRRWRSRPRQPWHLT